MDPIKYHVYIHREVAEKIYGLRGLPKRKLLDLVDELQKDPFCVGDFKKKLGARDLEVKVIDCLRSDPT